MKNIRYFVFGPHCKVGKITYLGNGKTFKPINMKCLCKIKKIIKIQMK